MDIVKTTEQLADILNNKGLTKINYKNGDVEICVESSPVTTTAVTVSQPMPVATGVADNAASQLPVSAPASTPKSGNFVTSPIIGVFYSAPAPGKPPFVKVGDKVKKGQVVCIIESMKLMNEINCEFDGTVAAILVMDGDAVDYGKELIEII